MVCSSLCPAPNLQSIRRLHAARAAEARRLRPSDWYTSLRIACPPLDSRQEASAFNQPLSFDTSSVTTMYQMLRVRSARALPSTSTVGSSLHAACTPPPNAASRSACGPSPEASLSTRQEATVFNQPLSLDTSKVTDMQYMFFVRTARALPVASALGSTLRAPCAAAAPRPSASRPALSSLFLSFPFHSAGSDGIQPAAELRHVQRHSYVWHVSGALRACLALMQPPQLGPRCALLAPPPPHALPPPGLHVAPLPMLPF